MRSVLIACVVALSLVAPAGAEVITVIEGWTVAYHAAGEPTTGFYGDGTYLFMSQGPVYKHQTNWVYLGLLGEVALPEGFPAITFPAGGLAAQVMVVPPAPVAQVPVVPAPVASCGPGKPRPHAVVIVVGGLPEEQDVIGPFATTLLAKRYAEKHCHGDYSIEPVKK